MKIDALLDNLAELGAVLSIRGNDLDIDAPAGTLTDRDIEALRAAKPELLRLQRIAEGLPPSEAAAECMEWIPTDPAGVPLCDRCGKFCDVQTMGDDWKCSACDPMANARKRRTLWLLSRITRPRHGTS